MGPSGPLTCGSSAHNRRPLIAGSSDRVAQSWPKPSELACWSEAADLDAGEEKFRSEATSRLVAGPPARALRSLGD